VQLFGSGLTSYQWTPATILNTFNVANPIATPFGTETYTVSGTDANGCSGTASVTVSMTILDLILNGIEVGNPANTFDDSYVISGSSPFQIDFDVISNGVDFGWDFSGDSIPDLFGANIPNQIFSSPGVQGMLIAELGNCSDTIFFIVDLFSNSFIEIIPNVITPNGDGLNDRFYVKANDIETFDLKIYNRNGQLLATISDIDEIAQPVDSFDTWAPRGEFNDGTYMYVYLAKGKDGQEFKGSGTLTVLGSE
jgi:gliding motility-associated-like protein